MNLDWMSSWGLIKFVCSLENYIKNENKWHQLSSIGDIGFSVTGTGQISINFIKDLKRLAYWM
jgi:hypothetical protein